MSKVIEAIIGFLTNVCIKTSEFTSTLIQEKNYITLAAIVAAITAIATTIGLISKKRKSSK